MIFIILVKAKLFLGKLTKGEEEPQTNKDATACRLHCETYVTNGVTNFTIRCKFVGKELKRYPLVKIWLKMLVKK